MVLIKENNMGSNQTSWALVNSEGLVETFLRIDLPENWEPPEGYSIVADDELPEGWQRVPEQIVVPATISARQIRLWLINNGYSLANVEAAINSISDQAIRDSTLVEWEYAPYIERSHPMLIPLASALGLTEQQVDQAFIEANII
jgi:hypothetical protein